MPPKYPSKEAAHLASIIDDPAKENLLRQVTINLVTACPYPVLQQVARLLLQVRIEDGNSN